MSEINSEEKENQLYEDYLRERSKLELRLDQQTEQADKYLLLTSGTLLTISITFFEKIVPLNDAVFLFLYYLSLVLLAFSVSSILYSFRASAYEAQNIINEYDKEENSLKDLRQLHFKSSSWRTFAINFCNKWSLISTIVAIALLVFFVIINLNARG